MRDLRKSYAILVAAASEAVDLMDQQQWERARERLQGALYEAEEEMIRDE